MDGQIAWIDKVLKNMDRHLQAAERERLWLHGELPWDWPQWSPPSRPYDQDVDG